MQSAGLNENFFRKGENATMSNTGSNRMTRLLRIFGLSILLIFAGLPLLLKLLHNVGFFEGWEGFGWFDISLRLLPWMAGLGILSYILGVVLKTKTKESN
jgi:hypothetical protein